MKSTLLTFRSALLVSLLLGCGANGQPDEATADGGENAPRGDTRGSDSRKSVSVALANPSAPVTEEDREIPAEKFADGATAFAHVRDQLKAQYYADGISDDDLYRAATAGMLEQMDPRMHKWNKLLSPHEMAAMRDDLKGEIVGVGMQITFDPQTGYVSVTRPIPGSAAERAGVLPADTIVRVNDKLYKGMKLRDVIADLRGKAGESVVLSVLRDGKITDVRVTRERVAYDTPGQSVFFGNVGYVRIPSFNEKTTSEVKLALKDLAQKKVSSVIVDLRQNPGGLFEEAIHTAELFVPNGSLIVSTKKRNVAEEKILAKGSPVLADVPLVVLVDGATASGGELLAEALREERHARLVGAPTMGKWSVQMIDDLANGYAFKYTLSLLFAPNGQTYDGIGLTPDIEVAIDDTQRARAQAAPTAEARLAGDVQLRTGAELLRR